MTTLSKQRRDTPEVYFPTEKYFSINKQFTDDLIRSAESAPRQRIRMCVHSEDDAVVHQMFIVHPGGAYVRPHKHNKKDESLLVLEGSLADLDIVAAWIGEVNQSFPQAEAHLPVIKTHFVQFHDDPIIIARVYAEVVVFSRPRCSWYTALL